MGLSWLDDFDETEESKKLKIVFSKSFDELGIKINIYIHTLKIYLKRFEGLSNIKYQVSKNNIWNLTTE